MELGRIGIAVTATAATVDRGVAKDVLYLDALWCRNLAVAVAIAVAVTVAVAVAVAANSNTA